MNTLLIAGSRSLYRDISFHMKEYVERSSPAKIISGGARGVDTIAEKVANLLNITIEIVVPEWSIYGKKAGLIRNDIMIHKADAALIYYDGESKGTRYTIEKVRKKGIPYQVFLFKDIITT